MLCTKEECCCPDSIEIDIWDMQLGLHRLKPKKLSKENYFKVINMLPAAEHLGFQLFKPTHVLRAYYVGNINPRVIYINGSNVREPSGMRTNHSFDVGVRDFGSILYNDTSKVN